MTSWEYSFNRSPRGFALFFREKAIWATRPEDQTPSPLPLQTPSSPSFPLLVSSFFLLGLRCVGALETDPTKRAAFYSFRERNKLPFCASLDNDLRHRGHRKPVAKPIVATTMNAQATTGIKRMPFGSVLFSCILSQWRREGAGGL